METKTVDTNEKNKSKNKYKNSWKTGKLVIGIIAIVFSVLAICTDVKYGGVSVLEFLFLLSGGILTLCTKKSSNNVGNTISMSLFCLGFLTIIFCYFGCQNLAFYECFSFACFLLELFSIIINCNNNITKGLKALFICITSIVPVILFIIVATTMPSVSADSTSNESNYSSSSENNDTKELSKKDQLKEEISNLVDNGLAYNQGNYIKGEITPGEYIFIKSGSMGYYSEEDAAGNIVDNEIFASFGYVQVHGVGNIESDGKLISISALDQLGISGAKEMFEILKDQADYNQSGYYKVGSDIEAGDYVVESIGSDGYYGIMSGPVSNGEIVSNDIFTGKVEIHLNDGQYLELNTSTITKN